MEHDSDEPTSKQLSAKNKSLKKLCMPLELMSIKRKHDIIHSSLRFLVHISHSIMQNSFTSLKIVPDATWRASVLWPHNRIEYRRHLSTCQKKRKKCKESKLAVHKSPLHVKMLLRPKTLMLHARTNIVYSQHDGSGQSMAHGYYISPKNILIIKHYCTK